ncbi:MAG: hypothetical protein AAFV69_02020 [Pseudomonadota bacterium]
MRICHVNAARFFRIRIGGVITLVVVLVLLMKQVNTSQASGETIANCDWPQNSSTTLLLFHKPSLQLDVIRGGRRIKHVQLTSRSRIRQLPTGVYSILRERKTDKFRRFRFTNFKNNWRATWLGRALVSDPTGDAIEARYAIKLPNEIAQELLKLTAVGSVLIVADSHSKLGRFDDIGLIENDDDTDTSKLDCQRQRFIEPRTGVESRSTSPVAIVISERDRQAYIYEDGDLVARFRVFVRYAHRETGRHVYIKIQNQKRQDDYNWMAISLAGGGFVAAPPINTAKSVLDRFAFEEPDQLAVRDYLNRSIVVAVVEKSTSNESRVLEDITLIQSIN